MASRTKVRSVLFNDDGLVHLVTVRGHRDAAHDAWMWCEREASEWADPPFVDEPATCLRCMAAPAPRHLPNFQRLTDETK